MKIKNPETEEFLDIYSARLTFIKEKNGQVKNNVCVTVWYNYKKKYKKRHLLIPKEIETKDLNWMKKKPIAVYYRQGFRQRNKSKDYEYTSVGVTISTNLGQRLENLVKEVCFGNSK